MKNVAYYHVYLDDACTWAQIFAEQMGLMERSKLFENLDCIKVSAITQEDRRIEIFTDFCRMYPVSFDINFIKNVHTNDQEMMQGWSAIFDKKIPNIGETPTLSRMYADSQNEDFNILYFHMKGITATLNNLVVPGRVSKYKNRYDWRQLLNWGVLTEWRQCVEALKEVDVAGADYTDVPNKFFRGNFFWTKSQHVRTLPDPEPLEWWEECKEKTGDEWLSKSTDRFRDERWICYKDDVKVFNLKSEDRTYIDYDI